MIDEQSKILGQGQHATVYKCFKKSDEERQHPFDVKVAREPDEEKRMAHEKEFKITNGLTHKNVVKSTEYFFNELTEEIHLVMEYVDGQEVLDQIAEQPEGHYTEDLAKVIFKQIMEGIAYLHSRNVAHRDIKPQNLLVTSNNHVYIMDFNVSFQQEDEHHVKHQMRTKTGTVAFSAPEIFTQQVYDEKVDIWSAGIVLYMMLSGQQPYDSDNMPQLVHMITTQERPV